MYFVPTYEKHFGLCPGLAVWRIKDLVLIFHCSFFCIWLLCFRRIYLNICYKDFFIYTMKLLVLLLTSLWLNLFKLIIISNNWRWLYQHLKNLWWIAILSIDLSSIFRQLLQLVSYKTICYYSFNMTVCLNWQ